MITNQDKFLEEQKLITQLFDTQSDSVIWFVPNFDAADKAQPVDFEVRYCNTAASLLLNIPKSKILYTSVKSSALIDDALKTKIWEQCFQVWKTGKNLEFLYYSEGRQKHFNVQRSKILGGILSITRDHTKFVNDQKEKEEQSTLLNKIIETSSTGISLYEAIRDKNGEISDFKLNYLRL